MSPKLGLKLRMASYGQERRRAAFTEWGQSALLVGELAEASLELIEDPQGVLWLGKVGEAASAGFNAISLAIFAFPDDSNGYRARRDECVARRAKRRSHRTAGHLVPV